MTGRPGRARHWVVGAAVAGSVALLAGCGVGAERNANRIEPEQVPFGLLEPEPTTTEAQAGRPVTVYLLTGDRLLAVERTLPTDGTLGDLLELVVTGPTDAERALGITSAVPEGTIRSVRTRRGVAQVDLAKAFGDLRSGDQILALGQIVYGLTAQPGIGSVSFSLDGDPIDVPRTDGTASDQPLSRDDFAALAPA